MSSKEQTHNHDKASSKQQPLKLTTENLHILVEQQTHLTPIIQRAKLDPNLLTSQDLLQLQRTIGNKATGSLLSVVQPHSANKKGKGSPPEMLPVSNVTSLPGPGLIQRVKGTAELEKAFAALGEDAYVTKLPTEEQATRLNQLIASAKTSDWRVWAIW